MPNENNSIKSSPNDQADGKFSRALHNMRSERDGVSAEESVRETEDASLQDKEYSFDEQNTDTEEYHDADADEVEDIFDNEEDLQ